MARENETAPAVFREEAVVFGPKESHCIKTAVPYFENVESHNLRMLVQVAFQDIRGIKITDSVFQCIKSPGLPESTIAIIYAAILHIVDLACRMPPSMLTKAVFNSELAQLKVPPNIIEDLTNAIVEDIWQKTDRQPASRKSSLPKLDLLRWRVDVGISTSVLSRVLEPTIVIAIKLDVGKLETFEVPVSKFNELRFNVTTVLREMEELEKRSILKITI